MADPVEPNFDEDQYADDFEEYVSDYTDEPRSRYESEEEDSDSDENKFLEKCQPTYNAPLVSGEKYKYESSSEEENEVVIGETVAEINTMAMNFTDASDLDAKSILTYIETDTETYTDRTKLPSFKKAEWDELRKAENIENNFEVSITDRTNVTQRKFAGYDYEDRSGARNNDDAQSYEMKTRTKCYEQLSSDSESEDNYQGENEYINDEEDKFNQQDEEESKSQDEDAYDNEEAFRRYDEYREINLSEEDSQSEEPAASICESKMSNNMENLNNCENLNNEDEENAKERINYCSNEEKYDGQYDEDNYEEDFEDSDQNENDEIDYIESDREVGGANVHIQEQNLKMVSGQIHSHGIFSENLSDSGDTSMITSMFQKMLGSQSESSVEGIESMIQVLNIIKSNLKMNNEGASNVTLPTSIDEKKIQSKAQSDTMILTSSAKTNSRSDTPAVTQSFSKIPCLISGYRKTFSSTIQTDLDKNEEPSTGDKGSSHHLSKREIPSDYDSCSISSKSSKHEDLKMVEKSSTKTDSTEKPKQFSKKIVAVSDYDSCSTSSSKLNCQVRSRTPSSFNSRDHLMHMNLLKQPGIQLSNKSKGSNRKNLSFSNERLREIERHNIILLKKIESQKASYMPPKAAKHQPSPASAARISSAAVNRKKQQRQIDLDNLMLKRKLEAIHFRRNKK